MRASPIRPRIEDHARGRIFLCLLAYYVEWHMRQALALLLFADEALQRDRKTRDPVATAQPAESVKIKKAVRRTSENLPVHSFDTLLKASGTRCRNVCRVKNGSTGSVFRQVTRLDPLQTRAFQLLGL